MQEIFTRSKRIDILKEILPQAKETLNYVEPVPDKLKIYLREYETLAFMCFKREYGKGIVQDKQGIAEAAQDILADETEQMNTITKGRYKKYETSYLLPSKDYDYEEPDASTINLFQVCFDQ